MPRRPLLALIAGLGAVALLAGPHTAAPAPGASLLGKIRWQMQSPAFGGFSGLEIGDDGASFVALSDRGSIVTGRLLRDAEGVVTGIDHAEIVRLHDPRGRSVRGHAADPEGLALAPDGRIFVSYEGDHRVWSYADPGATAEPLPAHPDFRRLRTNRGLEALAIDPEGRLVAIPEWVGPRTRPFPVYRWTGTEWEQPFTLPREAEFLPVGADFGADGRLYLLERDFRGLFGFYARISRFEIGPDGPGPQEVLYETRVPFQNNFEGIAAWRDAEGAIRLTLISDDNFALPLTTEFADFKVLR